MTWMSSARTADILSKRGDTSEIVRAFSLSRIARSTLASEDGTYQAIGRHVALTDAADKLIDKHRAELSDDPDTTRSAFFMHFFHHNLLIDAVASDLESILSELSTLLAAEELKIPHLFGRKLYDRFNDNIPTGRTDHMKPDQAWEFLNDTPQGVFQVAQMVTGPFGITVSKAKRYAPPTLSLPLWHCSDTGCRATHTVTLRQSRTPVVEAASNLAKVLQRDLGDPSEWFPPLRRYCRQAPPDDDQPYFDLPALLGDAVLGQERMKLLSACLSGPEADYLRKVISDRHSDNIEVDRPPDELASRLDSERQLQSLLLVQDATLVAALDDLILDSSISIPATEIRRAKHQPPRINFLDARTELASLGARSVKGNPTRNFASYTWHAYKEAGELQQLNWRLRNMQNGSLDVALMNYLHTETLATAVHELILTSRDVAQNFVSQICTSTLDLEHSNIRSILLWKLGADEPRYPDTYQRLKHRLTSFREVIRSIGVISTEDDREQVRRSGVNLFVSIESFLDSLASFNVWLLASDHFTGTKSEYHIDTARRMVGAQLGDELESGDRTVVWNPDGENSLGTLIRYLSALKNWVEGLKDRDASPLARADKELPHYYGHELRLFPFEHTELWADCDESELRRYAEYLDRIVRRVEQSDLAYIRNGLDHHREPARFPSAEEMLDFAAEFTEAFQMADVHRYIPKQFWIVKKTEDRFGRSEYVIKDYRGEELVLTGPSRTWARESLDTSSGPVIVAPGNLLGIGNAELVFSVDEESVYSNYWDNYPRHREIHGAEDDEPEVES